MYIIAGLGNPGKQYEHTRHERRPDLILWISWQRSIHISVDNQKHKAVCGSGYIEGQKVILVKPQDWYMNPSGESLREIIDFYKLDPAEELIVIYDDISLDPGQLRIRVKGSAGGHNGIKSIISHLGSEFMRVKMGVGEKPAHYDLADYVLGHFQKADRELVEEAMDRAVEAIAMMVQGDCAGAMNHYNKKVER